MVCSRTNFAFYLLVVCIAECVLCMFLDRVTSYCSFCSGSDLDVTGLSFRIAHFAVGLL